MDLKFKIIPTKYFLKQFKVLSQKEKDLVNSKIGLLKVNPFRFKKLQGYKNTFEIKLSINKNYSRLIYVLYLPNKNNLTIFGIFERKKDFKDFKNRFEFEMKK